ncbi:MAG: hypothetical protein KJZ60_07650, partial [Ignavibacteriaceae bacterium]|nr:hypothetical protein [Ignavibacteriaceae bacterium]
LESSGDTVKMHINKLLPIDVARNELAGSIRININKDKTPPESLPELRRIMEKYPGKIPVYLQLFSNGSKSSAYGLKNHRVELSNEFFGELNKLFGEDSIFLNTK